MKQKHVTENDELFLPDLCAMRMVFVVITPLVKREQQLQLPTRFYTTQVLYIETRNLVKEPTPNEFSRMISIFLCQDKNPPAESDCI